MKAILTESQLNDYMRFLAESRIRAISEPSDMTANNVNDRNRVARIPKKKPEPKNKYQKYVKISENDIPRNVYPAYNQAMAVKSLVDEFQKDHTFKDELGDYRISYNIRPATNGFIFLRIKERECPNWVWGKDRWQREDPVKILVKDSNTAKERIAALRQILKTDKDAVKNISRSDMMDVKPIGSTKKPDFTEDYGTWASYDIHEQFKDALKSLLNND